MEASTFSENLRSQHEATLMAAEGGNMMQTILQTAEEEIL